MIRCHVWHRAEKSVTPFDGTPSNGLPFSCRKRATRTVKKPTISRAQRSAGTAGWAGWQPTRACSRHDRTTPAQNHASTTRLDWSHAQHTTTLPITGNPHDGRSNHACITGNLHHGRGHPRSAQMIKKGCATTLPQPPNGLPFSSRKRAAIRVSKSERSRARSGRLERRVGWAGVCGSHAPGMTAPHRHGTTLARRAFGRDHAQYTITLRRTGTPHDGPANHACTTSNLHHGPSHPSAAHVAKTGLPTTLPSRPTVLPFRCRARHTRSRQKRNDLAREAVSWNGVLGGLATVVRVPPASADHLGTESRRHDARSLESHPARNHAGTTGDDWNHNQHRITPA